MNSLLNIRPVSTVHCYSCWLEENLEILGNPKLCLEVYVAACEWPRTQEIYSHNENEIIP